MSVFTAILVRDLRLAFGAGGNALQTWMFFSLTILIFALAAGPDMALLSRIAAPVLWTAALLSTLISLDRLFSSDLEDGSLDTIVEASEFLFLAFLAKTAAFWLACCAPLIILSPILGLLLGLNTENYWPMALSLFIGTPALSLVGALGAALTFSMRRGGVLVAILAAPLFTPIIIFGVSAAQSPMNTPEFTASLMILAALTMVSLLVAPLAGAAAIRFNMT